jgi:hypothetical protein
MKRTTMKGTSLITLALVSAFAAADDIRVTVNGNPVQFNAAQPEMIDGRVLVPLRGVFEQMGDYVNWSPANQAVMADGNGNHVRLRIGSVEANVNGKIVTMDVPPQIIEGSTMVPLRFLSESLGATVDWQPQNQLVALTTIPPVATYSAPERFVSPPPPPPPPKVIIREVPKIIERTVTVPAKRPAYVFSRDTVIPLRLDEKLTSNESRPGDRFSATVTGGNGRYMDFPEGTRVEGVVREARPASGSHGGTLDLRFNRLVFPSGDAIPVAGVVRMLDDENIVRTDNGRFVARNNRDNNIARDAEIGAGAGLLIGSIQGKAVGGAVLGGALGALVGALDHHMAHNVIFDRGTQFGLILNRDLTIDRRDLVGDAR